MMIAQEKTLKLFHYGMYNTEILGVLSKARDDVSDITLVQKGAFGFANSSSKNTPQIKEILK